ncbi:hypothetical protein OUZ56_003419 [Daphnia magna]|uniref:Uncharacterized protein n=1 Tax=Daphnia magna TaxID=35525 RepID=A0ABR0A924_9CRUS|nr:hypothetical protein OUZ56_003419 [Daphnia magna]
MAECPLDIHVLYGSFSDVRRLVTFEVQWIKILHSTDIFPTAKKILNGLGDFTVFKFSTTMSLAWHMKGLAMV